MVIPFHAAEKYTLDDFETNTRVSGSGGLTMIDDRYYLQTAINPNLSWLGAEVGLGLNLFLPLQGGNNSSPQLDMITIRHFGYNYKDRFGFRWGRLSNITFGNGLLMDNYDSGSAGSTTFSNEQAGFLGFASFGRLRTDALITYTQVQAARLSYRLSTIPVIETPLILGLNVVRDKDGIDILRTPQMGYSIDFGIPLAGEFLTVYSEFAELKQDDQISELPLKGSKGRRGFAAGGKGNIFNFISYIAEYRYIQSEFIPGYFNSTYETTSRPNSNGSDSHGFLVGAYTHLMNDYIKAGATYESVTQSAIASVGWRQIGKTIGVINYTIPSQGRDSALMEANVLYKTGGIFDYVLQFRRQYSPNGNDVDSYAVSFRANLDSVFPF
jgi:hypothetical protein